MSYLPHSHRHTGPATPVVRQPSALSRSLDRILATVQSTPERSLEGLQERRVNAPGQARGAALQPSSWNAEDRTIDVVWTTGARGVRFDWDSLDMVDEELATGATNVRLDRLNRGAPVLNTHQSADLSSQIGTVVPGTARMEGGRGVATIQLSTRDDIAPIVADIAAGIIRNISVGYRTHAFEVDMKAKPRPLYRAVDWEPFEISFVAIPFDAGAQVRDLAGETTSCLIRTIAPKEPRMSISDLVSRFGRRAAPTPTPSPSPAPSPAPLDGARELTYGQPASITWLRDYVGMACEGERARFSQQEASEIVLEFAERGLSEASARDALVQIATERQRYELRNAPWGASVAYEGSGSRADATLDNPSFRADAIQDALFARMSGNAPPEAARAFMGMSMVQMASDMLARSGTRDAHRMNASDILNAAAWNSGGGRRNYATDRSYSRDGGAHTTSDFPELLMGAGERFLLEQFAAASSPLKQISRRRTARDFRAISGLQLSGFGTLLKVPENGEIKSGTFTERKETYKLETFAKQFGLSRQAIINDDLGAFSDPIRIMARAASETEAQTLAALINSNPKLADGVSLFHANHGNLAPVGAPPSIDTLSAGRKAMRNQKDADGVTPLAASPAYIVAGTDNETIIEQLLTEVQAYLYGDVNPFAGKLTAAIDPRLDPAPWYLFGAPGSAPVLEHAYLDDQPGPHVEMKEGWNTLGTEFRVFMDFGAGLVDHRGGYKNPGK